MSDQKLAVQAISEAQRILEEYLEPKHHDNERLLDRLVDVLEQSSSPSIVCDAAPVNEPAQNVDPGLKAPASNQHSLERSPVRFACEGSGSSQRQ